MQISVELLVKWKEQRDIKPSCDDFKELVKQKSSQGWTFNFCSNFTLWARRQAETGQNRK